ncbi:DUF4145 domain-containing protein [Roseococcus sp. YIM B11640]|uniref:DUF4145 domain-containing protein n=1 Tax=Roseococcus sp. YIM B11640 TaxID=3133973 RepID=UPI003C7A68B8
MATFVIECSNCNVKVAAEETGRTEASGFDHENSEPWGKVILMGKCPACAVILVGESTQIGFENIDYEEDAWTEITRVYPRPPKIFTSWRIPRIVKKSLREAEKCVQAGANIATCVMLGRALEALCRDILDKQAEEEQKPKPKNITLYNGIKKLKDDNIIDDRLYNWSQQLHAFRNLAAHPTDIEISREDVDDLRSFVNAIVEYVYDLTERYNDFIKRKEARDRIPKPSIRPKF